MKHAPRAVADEPFRYSSGLHVGWAVQLYPLLVPAHDPDRYCRDEHFALSHEAQVPLMVEADPSRNSPSEQVGWSLHLNPSVVPLHEPD